ncbi:terpene synthase family protein [Pandoraea sp. NPDC090278]|uniref:terpene synthase family protein n=1 Tax=Pandoraea sp. NPDC090278 TaxID=3364391 RepID=UPI003839F30A
MPTQSSQQNASKPCLGDKVYIPAFDFALPTKQHPDAEIMERRVVKDIWPYIFSHFKSEAAAKAYAAQRCPSFSTFAYPNTLKDRIYLVMQAADVITLMDEEFTNQKVRDDASRRMTLRGHYLHAIDGVRPPDTVPIAQLLFDHLQAILATLASRPGVRNCLINAIRDQINTLTDASVNNVPTLTFEQYVAWRRIDGFGEWLATLTEYALDVDMSAALNESSALREIRTASIDSVTLVNDLMSFRKEFGSQDATNGLWALMREHDLNLQQAILCLVDRCRENEKKLIDARNCLLATPLGQRADVIRYMTELEHLHTGNAEWSSYTTRFHGLDFHGRFTSGEITIDPVLLPQHIANQ